MPILTSNSFIGSAKHCGFNFRDSHLNIASNKNYFYKKKTKLQAKQLGHLDKKNGQKPLSICAIQSKTTFQKVIH